MATAREVFTAAFEYWERTAKFIAESVSDGLTRKELNIIAHKLLDVVSDKPVAGFHNAAVRMTIDGNSVKCVRRTIMDVHNPNSEIRPYFRKVSTVAKALIALTEDDIERNTSLCSRYCIGCEEQTAKVCLQQLRAAFVPVWKKKGIKDRMMKKADMGEWKRMPSSKEDS
jgi:hypothetical protein